ncbi:hypothetical protein BJV74DRAFT_799543 [Russula compacta]|nr:hypothetical protein BJV74DRAFT_799543 [Russula compacta]
MADSTYQLLEIFDSTRSDSRAYLVWALAVHAELESVDPTQAIRETANLCRELLTSGITEPLLMRTVNALADAMWTTTVIRIPGLKQIRPALACFLNSRFNWAHSLDDYEEAMLILDEIIADPNENAEKAMNLAGLLAQSRFLLDSKPEHLAEAISRFRTYLNPMSSENPNRRFVMKELADLEKKCFAEFGVRSGRREDNAEDVDDSHLAASPRMAKSNCVEFPLPMPEKGNQRRHINLLRSILDIRDLTNIEKAIEYCRLCLTSPHSQLPLTLQLFKDGMDREEIMELFAIAVTDTRTPVPHRFPTSCLWMLAARNSRHPSTLDAYENAISLMQESLSFAPTLEIQHFRLVAMRDQYEKLPLNYAFYLFQTGQLEQAIETLERRRGLLWSGMRGLRTSINQLRAANLPLAEKFCNY